MKFIVDRQTWYRGHESDDSKLLREDGTRCCIGFVGQQCGIPDSSLLNRQAVHSSQHNYEEESWPRWILAINAEIVKAYRFNDRIEITDNEREQELSELFARHGDEIVFEN